MKPTVFFSHASADAPVLARLTELYKAKTGGSIDVFLSSDGQSIPFGRNWVRRVEEALGEAALMVVFLTPSSVQSRWIYFEAGHAYAQGLRVVPVGFLGIDMTQVAPPLGLLQGFTIDSEDGLDNLIALTNEVFSHTHPLAFTDEDYEELVAVAGGVESGLLSGPSSVLRYFGVELGPDHLAMPVPDAMAAIEAHLKAKDVEYVRESGLTLLGMNIRERYGRDVMIYVEPLVLREYVTLVEELCDVLRGEPLGVQGLSIDLGLLQSVRSDHHNSGRLYDSGVRLLDERGYARGDLTFHVSHPGELAPNQAQALLVRTTENKLPLGELENLLDLLFDRGWLYRTQ